MAPGTMWQIDLKNLAWWRKATKARLFIQQVSVLLSPHNNTRNAPEFVFHCSRGKRLDASQGTKAIYRGLKCSVSSFAHNNERQSQKVIKTAMKIYDCLSVRTRRKVSKMFLPRVVNLWMTNGIGSKQGGWGQKGMFCVAWSLLNSSPKSLKFAVMKGF